MDLISFGSIKFSSSSTSHSSLHVLRSRTVLRQGNVKVSCSIYSMKWETGRQSGEFKWDHEHINSLNTPTYKCLTNRVGQLKEEVKSIFKSENEHVVRLEIIDTLQRLGVAYYFDNEIKTALDIIHFSENHNNNVQDLYTTALQFRLLRQNRYPVHSEIFAKFQNEDGRFMECLSQDAKGLLSLYEASHLLLDGEDILDEAKIFSSSCLKSLGHLIPIPLHWRLSTNFVGVCEKHAKRNLGLLELANLDFSLAQFIYQRDLIEISKWWTAMGFRETLPLSEDVLAQNFIWSLMRTTFEPQFSNCRQNFIKFSFLLSAINDIYEVYGSLDEIEIFTEAVTRWDIKAIEKLPEYMKRCYLAMFNVANTISFGIHREQGIYVLPYIMEEWISLCKAYLVEARWFYDKYTPTLEEYLSNATTVIGAPVAILHAYILQRDPVICEELDYLKEHTELIHLASVIAKLCNELQKAEMSSGNIPRSIQCYIKETGVSKKEASEYIKNIISSSWRKLNEECEKSSLPRSIVNLALNMARSSSQGITRHGDSIDNLDVMTEDRQVSMFIEVIAVREGLVM